MPEHDGLSFMVLEALSAGRHVIWNHPFGGVLEAGNEAEAGLHLRRLLAQHSAGQLALNEVGRDAVRDRYSPSRVREEILGRFERLIAGAVRSGARGQ